MSDQNRSEVWGAECNRSKLVRAVCINLTFLKNNKNFYKNPFKKKTPTDIQGNGTGSANTTNF